MCESSELELFLDLGHIPRVDKFSTREELNEPEIFYPLKVYLCKTCGLAQLGYVVRKEELFNENYAYESNTTLSRQKNHRELAQYVCEKFSIPKKSLIIDIGSNVGMLLQFFKDCDMSILGIDASSNVVEIAKKNGIDTILGFFDTKIADEILSSKGHATVVTATNVFAHIQDYASFIRALDRLLLDDGLFVFQVPHFLQLVKNNEYDTIYHEHVCYFGLKPLIGFFHKHGFELFDVIETEIDGGSIRCFVGRSGKWDVSQNVKNILDRENDDDIYSMNRLNRFAETTSRQKQELIQLLIKLKQNKTRIVGIGAPAKGMTMLNYCKIDRDMIEYITEKSPLKIGKYTPGMHIPVVADQKLLEDNPNYALLLAWNFADEIMHNLSDFRKNGGKFIIPIPTPKII